MSGVRSRCIHGIGQFLPTTFGRIGVDIVHVGQRGVKIEDGETGQIAGGGAKSRGGTKPPRLYMMELYMMEPTATQAEKERQPQVCHPPNSQGILGIAGDSIKGKWKDSQLL